MGTAVISKCGNYRYRLSRDVGLFGNLVIAYFGVNPSTADAEIDDQTVKKWIGFTEQNGGKEFLVGNAFAFRATDVERLASASDPVGPENDMYLRSIIHEADILVPCWGSRNKLPVELRYRLSDVLSMLRSSGKPIKIFGETATGDPKHPLMLPYSTPLRDMK